jgi:cytochrome c2
MFGRTIIRACLIVTALLALAAPALAGGWAVVTLDELPIGALAHEPLTIGFMIRQHGQTPWQSESVRVYASNEASGKTLSVRAAPEGEPGHYVATLTFVEAGSWNWSIESGLGPGLQPMPSLIVTDQSQASGTSLPTVVWTSGIRLGAAHHAARLGINGLSPSSAQHGQDLFLAKGCVVCHTHSAVSEERQGFEGFQIGPNLTHLTLDAEYLHRWLKDPSAVKPATAMPTLGLNDSEIDSLVAFLQPATAGQ